MSRKRAGSPDAIARLVEWGKRLREDRQRLQTNVLGILVAHKGEMPDSGGFRPVVEITPADERALEVDAIVQSLPARLPHLVRGLSIQAVLTAHYFIESPPRGDMTIVRWRLVMINKLLRPHRCRKVTERGYYERLQTGQELVEALLH